MSEKVGELYYDVTLETGGLLAGQRKVDAELKKTTGSLDAFGGKLNAVAAAVKVLAVAMAAIGVAKMADELRMLQVRVQVAAGGIREGAEAMRELEAIAKRTQTSVAANAEVFARLNSAMKSMGGTQADTLVLVETLAQAIKVSGASATEAKSAMLQFGQALGSGKLAGDELRALMETAPYLMRQLADAIGVPVGSLKKLGEEGKLTSDVVAAAMLKASQQIQADFAQFPQTLDSAVTALEDAAMRANQAMDEMSGTSVALTGITKGLTEAVDALAGQMTALSGETDQLGRNLAIVEWSKSSRTALSYVIDAADVLWQTISVLGRNVAFVLKGVGTEIGGIAAQASAVLRGDFAGASAIGEAMKADAAQRRAELDAADKVTLSRAQTMGQRMREAWDRGAGGGRGFINPSMPTSTKLTPQAGTEDTKKKKKSPAERFDSDAYLSDLRKAQASEINAINETEAEKLRIARRNLDGRKINEAEYQQAVSLITDAAEGDRAELMRRTQEKIDADRNEADRQALADRKAHAEEVQKAMEYGATLTKAINPVDALRQEYEAKLSLVTQYEQMMAAQGVNATLQGQMARTQITNEHELQRRALAEQTFRSQGEAQAFLMDSVNALSSTATSSIVGLLDGTMSAQDAMRSLASTVLNEAVGALVQIGVAQVKNALLADTLAAADAAKKSANGAVYAASIGAQVTGMSALAAQNAFAATAAIPIVGPALAPAAAAAAGTAAMALGTPAIATAPIAGARQYGGPVAAGSMYRVNEGGRPEMFTAANGNQYLMPTQGGRVTPMGSGGGSGGEGGGAGWVGDINVTVAIAQDGSARTSTESTGGDAALARQIGDRIAIGTKETMLKELRPGGLLWKLKMGQV